MDELMEFLIPWAAEKGYSIAMPAEAEEDLTIDFININDTTKSIYIGNLNLEKELYEK